MTVRLCVVDDDDAIRDSLAERFRARGFSVTTGATGAEAIARARRGVDVMLLDLQMPEGDGIDVLRALADEQLDPTVVVLTAYGTVARAVEAMKAGAYDFLQKPLDAALLEETVRRAAERTSLRRSNQALRASAAEPELVAVDPAMRRVVDTARRASASASTVLLLGESGTGKEVLARAIHRWSPRADGPFVAVNCAALSESLLESELFGHEKGAFTGADQRRPGKLEAAHGGTLFLDEVGDTPPAFQTKLLRVLQERTFERVGGNESVEVDLRLVAATNRDLAKLVEDGSFREDLFYRLHVIALPLPPLRERPGDLVPLAESFVETLARESGRPGLELSDEAKRAIALHAWPGNARELRNAVERAVVLVEGDAILPEDLPLDTPPDALGEPTGFHGKVEAYRRRVLAEALAEHDGNQTAAAKALGLQRTYLARLLKKYELGPRHGGG